MQTALSSKAALGARPTQQRRGPVRRGGARMAPIATAAPEKTAAAANGAAAAAKADVPAELSRALKYQLATKSTDTSKLYQSGEAAGAAGGRAARGGQPSYHPAALFTSNGRIRMHPTAGLPLRCRSGLERAQPPGGGV